MASWVWNWCKKNTPVKGRGQCQIVIENEDGESVICGEDRATKDSSPSGLKRHIEQAHPAIFAREHRKQDTYGPMDAHVDRKPRFLDAFVDWIVTTYQSIDTCARPLLSQLIRGRRQTTRPTTATMCHGLTLVGNLRLSLWASRRSRGSTARRE